MTEKRKRAALFPRPCGHKAAVQHGYALPVAVGQVHAHAADRHDREQRNIHIKVVVAAHMIDGKRRKSAADVIRVIGMITEMEHGVRLFALDGVSHRHVIPMRI